MENVFVTRDYNVRTMVPRVAIATWFDVNEGSPTMICKFSWVLC